MARMLGQLVDRPLADAVAENRPGGPRGLTAPAGPTSPNPLKRDLRLDRDALARLEALLSRLA